MTTPSMPILPPAFLTQPFAHRGYHDLPAGRPENSRAAFQAAVAAGYGIELDVQRSVDDAAMVFHDYDLARLTGRSGMVRGLPAAELATIPLTGGSDGIPTLSEVLSIVAGRVPLLVEIKDQDGALGTDVGPLEHAVADALRGYAGPVAVMSFNPHSVAAMAALLPDMPRGLTTCGFDPADWPVSAERCAELRGIPDFDRVGASFISHDKADLDNPRVAGLKSLGAGILCWTIRSPEQEAGARRVADNITFEGYASPLP